MRALTRSGGLLGRLLAVCAVLAGPVAAEVPHLIRYQGQVADEQGVYVPWVYVPGTKGTGTRWGGAHVFQVRRATTTL